MSTEESRVLAEEQAALRRVATLVALGVPPEEVFAAVTEEAGRLLEAELAGLARFESDDTVTVLATWAAEGQYGGAHPLVPGPWPLEGGDLASMIARTGRPVRIDDYHGVPGRIAAFVREELGVTASVASPIVVEGRLWGALFIHSKQIHPPLPQDAESRLTGFTGLVATAIANAESRAALGVLADEQAALRRVATLVAQGTPPTEVFASVAKEVGRFVSIDGARILRYEADGTATVISGWSEAGAIPHELEPGSRLTLEGESVAALVLRTGRPARIDSYANAHGSIAERMSEHGFRSSAGAPIVVDGQLWGVMAAVSSRAEPLPAGLESRIAEFTELVATAIANTQARAEVGRLAEEQAALRRVATLVAREASPAEVFSAVTEELGRLLGADIAALVRLEPDNTAIVVAVWSEGEGDYLPVGTLIPLEDESVAKTVLRTGRPARADNPAHASGTVRALVLQLGVTSTVGAPIVVEGRLWGGMSVSSKQAEPLPLDTESRVADFAELVGTAIANAEARTELTASRARIVAAADETRRQIERDLHDGIQQRLVSLGLELRAAQTAVPPQLGELEHELSRVAEGLASVFDELREISHGIHPAILSEGGLEPALKALCRRSPVPVELDVHAVRRLPEAVEVAAYYVVSEALTNTAKHAQASVVHVDLDTNDAVLQLTIRDDGIGGADPRQGSGLVGLGDRIEAVGGALQVTSPAGGGTTLLIEIPLEDRSSGVSPER